MLEHRWDQRIAIDHAVQLSSRQQQSRGTIRNISAGGAYVTTRTPLPKNRFVTLTFRPPGARSRHPVTVDALVVYRDARGMGLLISSGALQTLYELAALRPAAQRPPAAAAASRYSAGSQLENDFNAVTTAANTV